jgi:hypothetical protein
VFSLGQIQECIPVQFIIGVRQQMDQNFYENEKKYQDPEIKIG